MLAYLSRYTRRVAIANSRLTACDRTGVSFRWKDYRAEGRETIPGSVDVSLAPVAPRPCLGDRISLFDFD